jgi:hypothetical protein
MMLHLHFVALLLLSTPIGPEPEITQHYRKVLVCEDISNEIENREVACQIEQVMRKEGFDSPLIKAALLNAYAESGFNPKAVGDSGNSKGVFQLNKNGLGNKMTDKERHDVDKSVRRVIVAIRKSPRLQRAIEDGAEVAELTELFCTEIMRPSNKREKARKRRDLEKQLFPDPASERGQT